MMTRTQRQMRPDDIKGRLAEFWDGNARIDVCVRAVYTRQPLGTWTYYFGQLELLSDGIHEAIETYEQLKHVAVLFKGVTLFEVIDLLSTTGLRVASEVPEIRLGGANPVPNWDEEIVPSHINSSRRPVRRYTIQVERNAFFPGGPLINYSLPYRASAAQYVREQFALRAFHSVDACKGQFVIEFPDNRGAIALEGGRISISGATDTLRLVGSINGNAVVDLSGEEVGAYDESGIGDVDLWLIDPRSDVVDYLSTAEWTYRYSPAQPIKQGEDILAFIGRGESEVCEFKPYVDLSHEKACELEKSVCAFSNQRGGTVFVGIDEDGSVIGLARYFRRGGAEIDRLLTGYVDGIRKRLRESLKDNQCFDVRSIMVGGAHLVVISVTQAGDVNFVLTSKYARTAFIRHGATSMKLTPPELKALLEPQGGQAL